MCASASKQEPLFLRHFRLSSAGSIRGIIPRTQHNNIGKWESSTHCKMGTENSHDKLISLFPPCVTPPVAEHVGDGQFQSTLSAMRISYL